MSTGTNHESAFQIGVTLAEEREGQVLATNDPWIKLSIGFRPYLAQLSGNEVKAFLAIGLRINKEYEAWPSLRTIGDECGFSRQTALRCVNRLKGLELIEIIHGQRKAGGHKKNTGNRYKIKMHFGVHGSDPKPPTNVDKDFLGVTPTEHLNGVGVTPEREQVSRLDVTELESLKPESLNSVVVGKLTKIGISKSVAKELAAEFPGDRIQEVLKMANGTNADNLPGLVVKSLRENWKQVPHRGNGKKPKASWLAPPSEFDGETLEEKQAALREELGLGPDEWLVAE